MPDTESQLTLEELDRWFAKRGFGFILAKEQGMYWADLFSRSSFEVFAPKYGTGKDPLSAATSARDRYIVEEAPEELS